MIIYPLSSFHIIKARFSRKLCFFSLSRHPRASLRFFLPNHPYHSALTDLPQSLPITLFRIFLALSLPYFILQPNLSPHTPHDHLTNILLFLPFTTILFSHKFSSFSLQHSTPPDRTNIPTNARLTFQPLILFPIHHHISHTFFPLITTPTHTLVFPYPPSRFFSLSTYTLRKFSSPHPNHLAFFQPHSPSSTLHSHVFICNQSPLGFSSSTPHKHLSNFSYILATPLFSKIFPSVP